MFHPENSLRPGGRFHLCWVADSWPSRVATFTPSQLISQDIPKICDNLFEVITYESGRPAERFSLRLSSKLLRGLMRLYQRKVNDLLGDIGIFIATGLNNANRRWVLHEPSVSETVQRPLQFIVDEESEPELTVEELIQNSANVVANIEEITLQEPSMPEIQLLENDDFGETSVEAVRAGGRGPPSDLSLDLSPDLSHTLSRLSLDPLMERISEHDIALFNTSIGIDLVQIEDLQKEIPELPEIPPPAPNDPPTVTKENVTNIVEEPLRKSAREAKKRNAEEETVLEELQPEEARGRARRGLLVDRRCKMDGRQFRARLACAKVHLRCQGISKDIVKIRVPARAYFSRPTQGGGGIRSNISQRLSRMFKRNLVVSNRKPFAERDMEEALCRASAVVRTRSQLQTIGEEGIEEDVPIVDIAKEIEGNIVNVTNEEEKMDVDILPTQVVERLSQAQKRVSDTQNITLRPRKMGNLSSKEDQQLVPEADTAQVPEADKVNIPANIISTNDSLKSMTANLREVGLADMPTKRAEQTQEVGHCTSTRTASGSSEIPLGSLDRTEVSLGDSDRTTESKRFICDQWGTEGTMVKILNALKEGIKPLNVKTLVSKGPLVPQCRALIMARCFTSLLRLKQHGFVDLQKDPKTLEIVDIKLGPIFKSVDDAMSHAICN